MSKYSPLKKFLVGQNQDHVPMTFAEIEKVLAFPLPPLSSIRHGGATIRATTR